jgi:hypothetical protein
MAEGMDKQAAAQVRRCFQSKPARITELSDDEVARIQSRTSHRFPSEHLRTIACEWLAILRAPPGERGMHLAWESWHRLLTALVAAMSAPGGFLIESFGLLLQGSRRAAYVVDTVEDAAPASTERQACEELAQLLNQLFGVCLADRTALVKTRACLLVANHLFKLYFHLNNLRMIPSLLRTINSQGFPPLSSFPISQLVTHKFYVGRLELLQGNYAAATEALSFAFRRCPRAAYANKKACLLFLIPLQLLHGCLPPPALLRDFPLPLYQELLTIVKTGNLVAFDQLLEDEQDLFIRLGILILLQKLRLLVFRVFIARLVRLAAATSSCILPGCQIGSRIGPHLHIAILPPLLPTLDPAEIECLLANIAARKLLKCSISHARQIVIFSKGETFSPLMVSLMNPRTR